MIRVTPAPEPSSFDKRVRQPGLRAIAELAGEKPARSKGKRFTKIAAERPLIPSDNLPPFWTNALDDLRVSYDHICAYSCFRIHRVTGAASVDHMAAKSRAWDRVYEWDNYRLACARLNSRKRDYENVLDPFEVQDDWFQLELVGFQVLPNPEIEDEELRKKLVIAIERLGLNDLEFRNARAEDAELYKSYDISLKVLVAESPFVARELRRQGRLNAQDA
jgi:hypothetical protein